MKRTIVLICILGTCGWFSLSGQSTLSWTLWFEKGNDHLLDASAAKIGAITDSVLANPGSIMFLNGHTGPEEAEGREMELAEARIQQVRSRLGALEECEVSSTAFGATWPLKSNSQEAGRIQNRRVEVLLFTGLRNSGQSPQSRSEGMALASNAQMKAPVALFSPQTQEYSISAWTQNVIRSRSGMVLVIPPDAFRRPAGAPDSLQLILKEVFSKANMIRENLSTTAQGRPLESAGMLQIRVLAGEEVLQLEEGKSITVLLPTDTIQDDMRLFRAQADESGEMDWQETSPALDRIEQGAPGLAPLTGFQDVFGGSTQTLKTGERGSRRAIRRARRRLTTFAANQNMAGEYAAQEQFRKKYPNLKGLDLKEIAVKDLNYYVFAVKELSWINCDRFLWEGINNLISIPLKIRVRSRYQVRLLFPKLNSVLPASVQEGQYVFPRLPVGQEATLFMIDPAKNQWFTLDFTCTKGLELKPEWEELDLGKLKAFLNELE